MSRAPARRLKAGWRVARITRGRAAICRAVLEALPDWFGIAKSREDYIVAAGRMPMLACHENGRAVGFVSLKRHAAETWDLYVLGVMPELHRRGVGRALIAAAERFVRARGGRLLTVKTLAPAAKSRAYDRTRRFYRAQGFFPVETFPTLWGRDNPCLLMAKRL